MTTPIFVAIVIAATVAMEPLSGLIHRKFGHGIGWRLHRGHHETPVKGPELNDVIPLVSAVVTIIAMAVGVYVPGWSALAALALGATIYGAVYFLVHDIYIHRRIPLLPKQIGFLEPFKAAHLEHHETGTDHWNIFSRPRQAANLSQHRALTTSEKR